MRFNNRDIEYVCVCLLRERNEVKTEEDDEEEEGK